MEHGPVDKVDLVGALKDETMMTRSGLVALATDLRISGLAHISGESSTLRYIRTSTSSSTTFRKTSTILPMKFPSVGNGDMITLRRTNKSV